MFCIEDNIPATLQVDYSGEYKGALFRGFFAWLRSAISIDEKMIRKGWNSDGIIYLIYLRECSKFFFVLSLLSICILCPFYYAESKDDDALTPLQLITVFEVKNSIWVTLFVFIVVWGYTIFSYFFIYRLVMQLKELRPDSDKVSESELNIANRTVIIRDIPMFLTVDYWDRLMNENIRKKYGNNFIAASTLGTYKKLYKLWRERVDLANKINKHMVKQHEHPEKVI